MMYICSSDLQAQEKNKSTMSEIAMSYLNPVLKNQARSLNWLLVNFLCTFSVTCTLRHPSFEMLNKQDGSKSRDNVHGSEPKLQKDMLIGCDW